MDYSTLNKAELQAEIDERNKDRDPADRIARTGSNPELIDRLVADDRAQGGGEDEDLLADDGDDGADQDVMAAQSFDAADPEPETQDDSASAVTADPEPVLKQGMVTPRLFETRYEMHGAELGTALHQEFLTRVTADAAAAGHNVKGGPFRERFEHEGGKHYAVYRVNVRG